MNRTYQTLRKALPLAVLLLGACSGGGGGGGATTGGDTPPGTTPSSYTIGGAVTGLSGSVVLQNNIGDNITVSADGNFTFATSIADNGAYDVRVFTQPTGQTCSVSTGAGTVSGGNVSNVAVACTTNSYTVGGAMSGLNGSVVLQNNGGDDLTVSTSGNFTFAGNITHNGTYAVTVLTQPTGQTCSVSTGAGTVSGGNVNNVAVTCATNAYTVGGSVSGLTGSVVLQDNSGDNLTVSANGAYTFATSVAYGSPFAVTVLTQPAGQSCSIANGNGTIAATNVSNVTLTCSTYTHTVGGTVSGLNGSMVLQINLGDDLAVSTNGAFNFATAVNYGTPYSVTPLSFQYPNQACAISNGSGTISANVSDVGVACAKFAAPRYAYTVNMGDSSVSTYAVDAASGRLKYIGKVATGAYPYSVTVHPSGKYVYVANNSDDTVSQYSIGADGALTAIGAAVATGAGPQSVTVDPTGKYAYVVNNGAPGTVSQYSIGADGALTAIGAAVAAGNWPKSVTVDPLSKYAYVVNSGSADVSQYTIGTDGALTAMTTATVAAGTSAQSVTVDPTGQYAYVANGWGTVSQYTIGADGALTAMTTATVAAGASPMSVTVDPTGMYAYVANGGDGVTPGTVSQYSISGGMLTEIGVAVAAGIFPNSVTVDPSGKYAYVSNYGDGVSAGTVSQYSIDATGALTPLSIATAFGMAGSSSIVVSAGAAPTQAVAKYAYVANKNSNTVSQYSVGANGAFTEIGAAVATGSFPYSVTVDSLGKYAYVANAGNGVAPGTISQYSIGTNGALTAMVPATVATGLSSRSVTVDPTGRYAYVTNEGDAAVSQYTIGANGALTAMATPTALTGSFPSSVTVDPSGKYAYVVSKGDTFNPGGVSQYSIGADGALTEIGAAVATGSFPYSITLDPLGKYAYVANSGDNTVSQYSIDATGILTAIGTAVAAGASPRSVTVDPTGKYAYVANVNANSISQYSIGADGTLTAMATAAVVTEIAPLSVIVDPSGKYAYVANYSSNTVSQYSIGTDGALTAMSTVAAGTNPTSVITVGTYQ